MPTASEMFGDELSPKKLAKKSERFDAAMKSSVANPITDPHFRAKVDAGLPQTFTKSLTADGVAALDNALAAQTADIAKDISLTSPLSKLALC